MSVNPIHNTSTANCDGQERFALMESENIKRFLCVDGVFRSNKDLIFAPDGVHLFTSPVQVTLFACVIGRDNPGICPVRVELTGALHRPRLVRFIDYLN